MRDCSHPPNIIAESLVTDVTTTLQGSSNISHLKSASEHETLCCDLQCKIYYTMYISSAITETNINALILFHDVCLFIHKMKVKQF